MKSKYLFCIAAMVVACLACGPALAQWTTYQGDASHDGYVPVSLDPAAFSLLWQRSLSTSALHPVTAGNGEVFVSTPSRFSSGTHLQTLDAATGQTKWSKDYGEVSSVSPPAYANGLVYIQTGKPSSGSPYLWAYNANTLPLLLELSGKTTMPPQSTIIRSTSMVATMEACMLSMVRVVSRSGLTS